MWWRNVCAADQRCRRRYNKERVPNSLYIPAFAPDGNMLGNTTKETIKSIHSVTSEQLFCGLRESAPIWTKMYKSEVKE